VDLVFLKERHIDTATYRTETEKAMNNVARTGD
jgi:hypothetical protein